MLILIFHLHDLYIWRFFSPDNTELFVILADSLTRVCAYKFVIPSFLIDHRTPFKLKLFKGNRKCIFPSYQKVVELTLASVGPRTAVCDLLRPTSAQITFAHWVTYDS